MCLGVVGVIFLVFAPFLIGIFTSDPEVVPYGVRCLRIVAAGFFFYGYGMVLTQAFNGAGDTRTPTWINLGCLWLWEIPLAWVLAYPAGLRPDGRLHRRERRILDAGARERVDLFERQLEDEAGVVVSRLPASGRTATFLPRTLSSASRYRSSSSSASPA